MAVNGRINGQSPGSRVKKTGKNPTDRGKQGYKRSILTDGRGIPISIVLAAANVPDYQLFQETVESIAIKRPKPTSRRPQGLSLDKGYEYDEVEESARRYGFDLHLRHKREKKRKPKRGKARHWVVERAHSWFNRDRAVLIRWEKEPENYEAMLHIAAALMAYNAAK
jgi:putative transposase